MLLTVGMLGRRAFRTCKTPPILFCCAIFALLSLGVPSPAQVQTSICAEVKIQINRTVPATNAAGQSADGERFNTGATMTYQMTGGTKDRIGRGMPETIKVTSQPKRALGYFLPGDVYADDLPSAEAGSVVRFILV